jgi:O-antigen/teichoic acid export membrane protein
MQTSLFKISSLNSLSVIIKLVIGFITSKVIAVFVGPSGMALVGNFRNFVGTLETLSTFGSQNGIVKYIAENQDNKLVVKRYFSTIIISVISVSTVISLLLFFLSDFWNEKIFGSQFNFSFVFKAFAFALPFYALSLVLIAIINGFGKFKTVIYINIVGNIIGLLCSVFFIFYLNTLGALLTIIISPSLLFGVAYYYISKEIDFFDSVHIRYFDFKIIKGLSQYFIMAFVAGIFGSIVFLMIRKHVIHVVGIEQAGYWEAITRISTYYLMFVSSILTLYFLPKLTIAKNNQETKKMFWSYYKTIFPVFILGVLIIYFLRFFIVRLLFTQEFLPVTTLFFWQLLGDTLKIASWILGFQFIAKKLTVAFIVSEIFSLSVAYVSSMFFINEYGIEGVVMAHALTYFIYFIVLIVYFRKSLI